MFMYDFSWMFHENDNWKFEIYQRNKYPPTLHAITRRVLRHNDCRFLLVFQWELNWSFETRAETGVMMKSFFSSDMLGIHEIMITRHNLIRCFEYAHSRFLRLNGLKNSLFSSRKNLKFKCEIFYLHINYEAKTYTRMFV